MAATKIKKSVIKNWELPYALEFNPKCHKTQEMRDRVVNTRSSLIQFVHECYKTQEMCD